MANVTGQDIINKTRIYAAEPNPGGRWSDSDILSLADDACTAVSMRADFPESIFKMTALSGTQEYALPEVMAILRVYVAGQLIFPTDIPTLQAEQIEVFDQSGANYTPAWTQVAAATYPVANDMASPVPAVSYYPGQRPQFYLRGANIGFVPTISGTPTIQIDAIPIPIPLTAAGTQTNYPHIFLPALAHHTAAAMYSADSNDAMANIELGKYELALKDIVAWKRNFVRNKPRRTFLYPYRIYTYGPWPSS